MSSYIALVFVIRGVHTLTWRQLLGNPLNGARKQCQHEHAGEEQPLPLLPHMGPVVVAVALLLQQVLQLLLLLLMPTLSSCLHCSENCLFAFALSLSQSLSSSLSLSLLALPRRCTIAYIYGVIGSYIVQLQARKIGY